MSEQVKVIQNLKIDKITLWNSSNSSGSGDTSTAGFLKGMGGSLPPVHELARQADIDLPAILGKVADIDNPDPRKNVPAAAVDSTTDDAKTDQSKSLS